MNSFLNQIISVVRESIQSEQSERALLASRQLIDIALERPQISFFDGRVVKVAESQARQQQDLAACHSTHEGKRAETRQAAPRASVEVAVRKL